MPVDLRVYGIVDPEHTGGRSLAELAHLEAKGGATLIQLRDKLSETRAFVENARAVKAALDPFGVPLLINDRIDVALACGAAGVHIGQTDMTVEDARRLLPPGAIVGLTVNKPHLAEEAPLGLIDYAGVGGVYGTTSKQQKNNPIGREGLKAITDILRKRWRGFPVVGIAGINASNAAAVIDAGADGISVIAALSLAPDPEAATRELRAVVDKALEKHRGRA